MEYIGEHLWTGKIGNLFVILSFVFALVSAISYFFATKENEDTISWKRLGRLSFRIHGFSVFGIVATLFIMLSNHYFEYEYVWHHSNKEMPMRYILSCFWEGQEGSFLLWTFWHVIIGLVLQFTAKKWEAPVMVILAMVQVFLASMLLGIVLFEHRIGSNPFTILLRNHADYSTTPLVNFLKFGIKPIEHPEYFTAPLKSFPNYLELINGKGLNPLLQNYWMTIHPPTLFLGFALTVVPFAYALAGLWKKQFTEWIQPALPWAYFGVAILGIGILMGGAWAYEALSFGGFWAWDPVENASLVPWLTLVGGAHVMLISKKNNQANFIGFFLIIISFILILYSTFLTRSGILGESSVHAFTDLGMSGQLLIYLFFFLFLGIFLLIIDKKIKIYYAITSSICGILTLIIGHGALFLMAWLFVSLVFLIIGYIISFAKQKEEEGLWSREFWMFVGAVILLVSSFQIIFYTSMPVWNKLFDLKNAPIKEVITFYNNWQIPFAIIITLLIAISQYFKYKKTDLKYLRNKILTSFVISVLLSLFLFGYLYCSTPNKTGHTELLDLTLFTYIKAYLSIYFKELSNSLLYFLLLFTSIFAVFANANYFLRVLKGKVTKSGASIAHIGFALVLLGALLSTSKKDIISQNSSGKDISSLGEDFSNNDNILLQQKDTLPMGKYYVTYVGKRHEGINVFFDVDYFTKNQDGTYEKAFLLSPKVQTNPKMGNVAEPDTRHFLTFDVYTHVTYADLEKLNEKTFSKDEYTSAKNNEMKKGDTIFASNAIIVFDSLSTNVDITKHSIKKEDIAVQAHLTVLDIYKKYQATPIYIIHENTVETVESKVNELGLKFSFTEINPEKGTIQISLQEKKSNIKDFIVMQAIVFPYINILWMGCIVMFIGTLLAVIERIKNNRRTNLKM